jgi:hypothetical protein
VRMTQTYPDRPCPNRPHPNCQAMRDHAEAQIASFAALPAPQTLTDMLRTARLLMALDRTLTQLWKVPADMAANKMTGVRAERPATTAEPPATADLAATEMPSNPLNRQQRRALEARSKTPQSKSGSLTAHPVMSYATG